MPKAQQPIRSPHSGQKRLKTPIHTAVTHQQGATLRTMGGERGTELGAPGCEVVGQRSPFVPRTLTNHAAQMD